MAYQLKAKGKGKALSSISPLDLSRLFTTQSQQESKRKKNSGGLPERVYWSPVKFSLNDRMLHYSLAYVLVLRYSNHYTIIDSEMLLLYAIKNNIFVDWGHVILCHMLTHNEHADGLPYAHFITRIFHHFNVNLENEAHSDEEIKPPLNHPHLEDPAEQPSNQMIMDYLHGFRMDVMIKIGHLVSRMDQWELFQGGFPGGGSNADGDDI
ncbi:hypothetical protein KIW84_066437 [Lathyrus oleraceus]|uniref:Uncharacterized protein n=1 Tax=Pisum sativum TaxID=3888 RepID=A0A9D4WI15_PEA|nr:hypothetical protein KIW84_066437 [Pisum sativum]